jgi:hypothetical protein
MPTKRKRRTRPHMALQAHEIEWLTGVEQPNAGKLWNVMSSAMPFCSKRTGRWSRAAG